MDHLLEGAAYTYNYSASASGGAATGFLIVVELLLYVITGVGMYGTFRKAGQPGWAGFVPIYNLYILLKIAGRPTWWLWFVLAPLVIVIPVLGIFLYVVAAIAMVVGWVLVLNDTSKSFGHGGGFTVGLFFLPVVFFPVLGFDQNSYLGPAGPEGRVGGFAPQSPSTGMPPPVGWNPPPPTAPVPPPPPPPATAG